LNRLYPSFKASPVVVDLGAGVSPYRSLLLRKIPNATYFAFDFAASAETSVVADIANLPLSDACADLIFCFDVLQHVESAEAVMAEMYRTLRAGGHVMITVPFLYAECDVRDFRRWTIEGISKDISRAGFEIVACRPRGRVFFLAPILLSSFVPLLFPRPTTWRAATTFWSTVRSIAIALVVLPFHLLGWIGLLVDFVLPLRGAYMGSTVLATKPLGTI